LNAAIPARTLPNTAPTPAEISSSLPRLSFDGHLAGFGAGSDLLNYLTISALMLTFPQDIGIVVAEQRFVLSIVEYCRSPRRVTSVSHEVKAYGSRRHTLETERR
jgi:hypothetical protein